MKCLNINSSTLEGLKETYRRQGCVKILNCLSPSVLNLLTNSFQQKFEKRFILDDLSSEYSLTNPLLQTKINFIFNLPEFLSQMSEIIGVSIRFTKQRLYYVDSTCESLLWHDDSYDQDGRVAAIRYELSEESYEGGSFQFKDDKHEHLFECFKLGDAVLFKVEFNKIFHQVLPISRGSRRSLIVFLCE
jgi:hypothetical protein